MEDNSTTSNSPFDHATSYDSPTSSPPPQVAVTTGNFADSLRPISTDSQTKHNVPTSQIYPTPMPHVSPPMPSVPVPTVNLLSAGDLASQPVVNVLSPRGIEYVFLTIALFTAAIGLGSALISLVNGQTNFDVLSFPVASLVVSLPVFAFLFLRLKKSEMQDPSLKHEASKRRATQFTQITSFVVCFFTLIGFISTIFAKMAGQYHGSLIKIFLDVLAVLLIAGGLLAYYWRDEHRIS